KRDLAARVGVGPTLAYAAVKAAVDHAAVTDLAGALANEAQLQRACAETADHAAATKAFLRKEQPVFEGR
ncbi:enoyl-CoA hydratase, partial [Actinoallomurus acaciae]